MRTEASPRARILTALRRDGASSIDGLRSLLGLSKTATRAHLVRLESAGLVARAALETKGRGRPPMGYHLTALGSRAFPTTDGDLLARLLTFLEGRGEGALVAAFFSELWGARREELDRRLAREHGPSPTVDQRLGALRALLEDSHFMPALERSPGDDGGCVTLRECHCPLPRAAGATRIPCHLELAFLEAALGARAVRSHFATDPTDTCVFELCVPGGASPEARPDSHRAASRPPTEEMT